MAYWIFKCNPEKYRLADRLADPNPTTLTWTVSRHRDEIGPGDTVFPSETGSGPECRRTPSYPAIKRSRIRI